MKVITDDPELRKPKSYGALVHDNIVACLEERISSWPRLKNVIGLRLCYKKKPLKKQVC